MNTNNATMNQDQFARRLLGSLAFGIALLTSAYGAYFAFLRGPTLWTMLLDFDVAIPRATRIALAWPWIPLVSGVVATVAAGWAWRSPRRSSLAAAYVLTFAAVVLTLGAEIAARWPTEKLVHSLAD
jgi:hypothetical protein